ncbi:MAG: hypothetical protein Q3M30_07940 [Candidatus Electrothrix sp. Rat3]|nr:hypothetical protein [Candidatus Electrothrix rattekaaiensis]
MYSPCHLAESNKEHYLRSFEALDKLASHISGMEFSSSSFGDVEAVIQEKGRKFYDCWHRGICLSVLRKKKKEFVLGEDGIRRNHRRTGCTRKIESRFGEVKLSRIGYCGPFVGSVFPLDAELNLPPNKYSHGLRSEIAHLTAVASFDETLELLERQGGGILPKRQLQEVSADIVRDFKEFYEQPLNLSSEKGSILVITADGKGVSMHNQDLRPAAKNKRKRSRIRKSPTSARREKGRKRMATVVSVYETSPYQRTPEQLLNIDGETAPPRPEVKNKRVWAEITEDMGNALDQGFQEALRRDPEQKWNGLFLSMGRPI